MRLRHAAVYAVLPGLLALAPPCRRGRAVEGPTPAERELGRISTELSEPGGFFDTDNLISNETAFLQVSPALAHVPKGGVYVGVGPEQNFTYIARTRPAWAYVVDVRRDNALLHLTLGSLIAAAEDPYQFLCGLLGRPCPRATPAGALRSIDATLLAVERTPPDDGAFERALAHALQHARATLGSSFTATDQERLRAMLRAFYAEQLDLRFRTYGRSAGYHPTLRSLLLARDPTGEPGHFLARPDDYAFVRGLVRAGRVVPVTGDFAGPKTLRALGARLRVRGERVTAFYVSNVEYYLLREGSFHRFVDNVRALPADPHAVLIRACFEYGRVHPLGLPGHRSATVLEYLPRFLELFDAGRLGSYWDVCIADYIRE
jgi:hypothetical protein